MDETHTQFLVYSKKIWYYDSAFNDRHLCVQWCVCLDAFCMFWWFITFCCCSLTFKERRNWLFLWACVRSYRCCYQRQGVPAKVVLLSSRENGDMTHTCYGERHNDECVMYWRNRIRRQQQVTTTTKTTESKNNKKSSFHERARTLFDSSTSSWTQRQICQHLMNEKQTSPSVAITVFHDDGRSPGRKWSKFECISKNEHQPEKWISNGMISAVGG